MTSWNNTKSTLQYDDNDDDDNVMHVSVLLGFFGGLFLKSKHVIYGRVM